MDTSKLFMNAVKNLYINRIYTVDFAILKLEELSNRNRINATDYTELLTYLAEEQQEKMQVEEPILDNTEEQIAENTDEPITEE